MPLAHFALQMDLVAGWPRAAPDCLPELLDLPGQSQSSGSFLTLSHAQLLLWLLSEPQEPEDSLDGCVGRFLASPGHSQAPIRPVGGGSRCCFLTLRALGTGGGGGQEGECGLGSCPGHVFPFPIQPEAPYFPCDLLLWVLHSQSSSLRPPRLLGDTCPPQRSSHMPPHSSLAAQPQRESLWKEANLGEPQGHSGRPS